MKRYPELVIASDQGSGPRGVVLGTRQVSVGRGPDNDVVIPDPEVSRHHALFWCEDGGVFVRDMGSANGTFLDGERVVDTAAVPYGATLRLGKGVELSLRAPRAPLVTGSVKALALEDVASGTRWPLHSDRFVLGSGPGVDLRLDDCESVAATLIVYPHGEVWLGQGEEDQPIEPGTGFVVAGSRFRIVEVDPTRQATVQPDASRYAYRLKVGLDGPGGPSAEISLVRGGTPHALSAENRVVLLYLLARKLVDDRQAGLPEVDQGWCSDDDVIVGVWGRSALTGGANRLKVLVHRVRKELREDGFEPWCIEKRSGLIRGRFAEVDLS